MAKGALIAAMDFSNVDAGEFNDWYDTEHIPERQRVPGFLTLQRWIGAENPRQSVATYDLDNVAVLQSPEYRAIGGENLSPWSKRVTAKVERLLRYEGEQIDPGDKTTPANAGGLLLVGMTPGAEVESGVQHVVRQGTPPCPFPRSRRAVREAFPKQWRRHEIRGAVSSHGTRRDRVRRSGSKRAGQPRCRNMCATRSATAFASSAEITCGHRSTRRPGTDLSGAAPPAQSLRATRSNLHKWRLGDCFAAFAMTAGGDYTAGRLLISSATLRGRNCPCFRSPKN